MNTLCAQSIHKFEVSSIIITLLLYYQSPNIHFQNCVQKRKIIVIARYPVKCVQYKSLVSNRLTVN